MKWLFIFLISSSYKTTLGYLHYCYEERRNKTWQVSIFPVKAKDMNHAAYETGSSKEKRQLQQKLTVSTTTILMGNHWNPSWLDCVAIIIRHKNGGTMCHVHGLVVSEIYMWSVFPMWIINKSNSTVECFWYVIGEHYFFPTGEQFALKFYKWCRVIFPLTGSKLWKFFKINNSFWTLELFWHFESNESFGVGRELIWAL